MGYHNLSESTLTAEERREEAARIVERLLDFQGEMTEKEQDLIEHMDGADFVSVKQLFWLRDINNKY